MGDKADINNSRAMALHLNFISIMPINLSHGLKEISELLPRKFPVTYGSKMCFR
jgi:hypothetical protein